MYLVQMWRLPYLSTYPEGSRILELLSKAQSLEDCLVRQEPLISTDACSYPSDVEG